MWKKRKDIEGVSASSMLELKAELYEREQQAIKRPRDAASNAKRGAPLEVKNRGVEARAARDLAQSQASAVNSIASLERKAALYNSAAASSSAARRMGDEHSLIDWEMKQWDRQATSGGVESEYHWSETQLQSADTRREQARRHWEEQQARDDDEERARDERLATLNSVVEQNDRERAALADSRAQRKRLQEQRAALIRQKADDRKRAVAAAAANGQAVETVAAVVSPPSSPPPPPPPPES
jgi:hypothetical protein